MHIRTGEIADFQKIKRLYQAVAGKDGGIARLEYEITDSYVDNFLTKSLSHGFMVVAEHPENGNELVGEIHAFKPGIAVFDHVLSDLTIVVHPEFQNKKIGRTIFTIFLEEIGLHHPDIGRVELVARESNFKAIEFYQSLGFRIEGRMEMRIKTSDGHYEADIPMAWQNPNFEFD